MHRWLLGASMAAISAIVALPLLALVVLSFDGEAQVWSHLASTVLGEYVLTSLALMLGVGIGTSVLGIASAYVVTQYSFTGRRFFTWALLLPLAMPTYITAYAYTGLLDIAGPVQSAIRSQMGLQFGEYWFPQIRSLGGAIVIFSLVLYPYVYLLVRASLLNQSPNLNHAARLFGKGKWQRLTSVTLPLARPAIVAGVSLALMETLADFGAVSYFGISTFTTGIYRTWNGLNAAPAAAQLSLSLLSFIVVLVILEKSSRKRAQYEIKNRTPVQSLRALKGWGLLFAFCVIGLPILLGFAVPVFQLALWAISYFEPQGMSAYLTLVNNTVTLALLTSVCAAVLATTLIYAYRILDNRYAAVMKSIVGMGYALPGVVIAVGTLIPLALWDNGLDSFMRTHFDISTGLLLSGTLFALIFAYLVRFLTVSVNALEPGFANIPRNLDMVTRSLGERPWGVLKRVHFPLLRPSLLSALLIVFVEVMKELPATLILRPFNFNTLAVRAFELASDERLPEAALASLTIVVVGLIPVILLTRLMQHRLSST